MNRIEGVDLFRLLAITAVIAIHTEPFSVASSVDAVVWKYLGVLINQLARFAVPFFFVISGYFWGTKVKRLGSVASVSIPMAKRIFLVFAVWSVVYAVPYSRLSAIAEQVFLGSIKVAYWDLIALVKYPINLEDYDTVTVMMQGTRDHLWFLIALLCSIGISSFLVWGENYKMLVAVSVALYLIGLLAKAYANSPFGLHANFNTRNGPFFGTIFFVSGYFLSNLTPTPGWFQKGVALLGVGWLLHFSETYLLWSRHGTNPYLQDYVIGTYFMGIGAAIAALSNHPIIRTVVLGNVGKFTMGIYVIHLLFFDMLRPVVKWTRSPLWQIGEILLILVFSLVSVMVLQKSKITRSFVV